MHGTGTIVEIKRALFCIDEGIYDYVIVPHNDENIVKIEKKKKIRSKDANAYFHVLVNKIAAATGISDEESKIIEVLKYGTVAKNQDDSPVTVKLPKGTDITMFYKYAKWYGEKDGYDFYMFYKETHTLDRSEMRRLIDGVVSDCKELGIETLDDIKLNTLIESWT